MSGTKATGKTIGEVEQITGIPKRELKYYMEQGVMRPSQKSESGYWLYSDEDIRRARLASLCRELGFPVQAIRAILADPALHWPEELERQIFRLTDKRDRAAAQLALAESLCSTDPYEALEAYSSRQSEKGAALTAN